MIGQFLRIFTDCRPDGLLLENVESLLHPKHSGQLSEIYSTINNAGYYHLTFRANAANFGVPQRRKRVFIFASKQPIHNEPALTHSNDNTELPNEERVIDWIAPFSSAKNLEKEEVTTGKTYHSELTQIPPGRNYFALTTRDGHPSPKFEANKRFWSFLLKLHPLKTSWTIAAQPGPWVGPLHWENRRLRVAEIAAIQTFPRDFRFHGTRRSIQKQIGNAVPPLLGKAMVQHLIDNLK